MYTFLFEWDPMHTPVNGGVRFESHFHKNAYMYEQSTIEFDVCIVDRKNLNWCTSFSGVEWRRRTNGCKQFPQYALFGYLDSELGAVILQE